MTSEEIENERREDYKLLGSFIGLAELVEEDAIAPARLREKMIELIRAYHKRALCPHGKRLDDLLGCSECDNTKDEVRQSV